jgi:hypothetical protein
MYQGLGDDYSSEISLMGDVISAVPLPGAQEIGTVITELSGLFKNIGKGRTEADKITPNQNTMMNYLGKITDQIRTGQNPTVFQLQQLFMDVLAVSQQFIRFVSGTQFTDRRASGQALNTVMPYVDGSCGYPVPLPGGLNFQPGQSNCITWGDGTIGGAGTTGMLGAIQRAIVARGGALPAPSLIQSPVPTIGTIGPGSLPQPGLLPAPAPPPPTAPLPVQASPFVLTAGLSGLADPLTIGLVAVAIMLWPRRRV